MGLCECEIKMAKMMIPKKKKKKKKKGKGEQSFLSQKFFKMLHRHGEDDLIG